MSYSFLRQVSLFSCLSDQELEDLAQLTSTRSFRKGNVIILAEEEGDAFFVIRAGQVKVSIIHEDGRELILSLLGPGKVFGELSLLDGKPRSANVVALKSTDLITLRRADFFQLVHDNPQVAISLLAELASRLRRTDHKIEGLALLDVASRVAEMLLQLALDQGIETPEGLLLQNRPTHQQLANMAGTTRETTTRVFKRLETQGYISCRGRDILIRREENADEGRELS